MGGDSVFRDGAAGILAGSTLYVCSLAIPMLAYAVLSGRLALHVRIAVALATAGAFAALAASTLQDYAVTLAWVALGVGYLALCAAGVFAAHRIRASVPVDHAAMFGLIGFFFVLVPAIAVPGAGRALVLLSGWEMMLAAYSFYVDAPASRKELRLRDCLVFIAVNPCLVLAESGRIAHAPQLSARGLRRIGLGAATLAVHALLFSGIQVYSGLSDERFARWPLLAEWPLLVLFYLGHVVLGVLVHSGRASIQIGMMKLMGHELPERYDYPLAAKDPVDFWRRWNIYVGAWFRRYIFFPFTIKFPRLAGKKWRVLAVPMAVIVTFLACGVWHDFAIYARTGQFQPGVTIVFLLHGVLVIGWAAIAAALVRGARQLPELRRAGVALSRVCFLPLLAILTWLVLPPLAGVGLHPALKQLLGWIAS